VPYLLSAPLHLLFALWSSTVCCLHIIVCFTNLVLFSLCGSFPTCHIYQPYIAPLAHVGLNAPMRAFFSGDGPSVRFRADQARIKQVVRKTPQSHLGIVLFSGRGKTSRAFCYQVLFCVLLITQLHTQTHKHTNTQTRKHAHKSSHL
jgi:hypothetical protein